MDPKPMRRDPPPKRAPPKPILNAGQVRAEYARRFGAPPERPEPGNARLSALLAASLKGDGDPKAGYRTRVKQLKAMLATAPAR